MLFNKRNSKWNRRTVGEPYCVGESLTMTEYMGGDSGPSYGEAYQFYLDEFYQHVPQGGFWLLCGITVIFAAIWVVSILKGWVIPFSSAGNTGITVLLAIMCLLCGHGWLMPRREASRFARYASSQTANVRTAYIQAIRNGICSDV